MIKKKSHLVFNYFKPLFNIKKGDFFEPIKELSIMYPNSQYYKRI